MKDFNEYLALNLHLKIRRVDRADALLRPPVQDPIDLSGDPLLATRKNTN